MTEPEAPATVPAGGGISSATLEEYFRIVAEAEKRKKKPSGNGK